MEEAIPVQVTKQGILIPHEALGELDRTEIEVPVDERTRVAQVLRDAGLLYEPDWEQPPSVSPQERARLAQKLASDPPLSEMIIADREDRV